MFVSIVLHNFQITSKLVVMGFDLGYWVVSWSTTWFFVFLFIEYNDDHWIQNFRMSKLTLLEISNQLKPMIVKKDAKYCLAIPMEVWVTCVIYKLSHGSNLLICSELFVIGRLMMGLVLWKVVRVVIIVFKSLIFWPMGQKMEVVMMEFKDWHGLPNVHGVIDSTHISISKPKLAFAMDYYYHKSGSYSIVAHVVVDVSLPRNINDFLIPWKSNLYKQAQHRKFFKFVRGSQEGFTPYLFGDKGYSLLPWIMILHKETITFYAWTLYNRKHKWGWLVVKNAFGILKQNFWEFLYKINIDVNLVLDVFTCCCLLHNLILGWRELNI
jgi:hypothetical protein